MTATTHRTPCRSTAASLAGRARLFGAVLGVAIVVTLCAGACSNSITYSRIDANRSDGGVDRPTDAGDGPARGTGGSAPGSTGGAGGGNGGAGAGGAGGTDAGIDAGIDTKDGGTGLGGAGAGGMIGTGGAGTGGAIGTGGAGTGGAGVGGAGVGGAGVGGAGVGGTPGTGGAIVDSAQYNFETTAQGWAAFGAWTGFGRATAPTFAGLASLGGALTYTPVAGVTGTASELWLSPAAGTGPIGGNTVRFHIFLPANAAGVVAWVQPYVQDGSAAQTFTGTYTAAADLRFGGWTTITVTLPATAVVPIFKIAVQMFTGGAVAFTGAIYIDSIGW